MSTESDDITVLDDRKMALSALLKAQKEIANPVKDSQNPHFKNKYASLEEVIDSCKQVLNDNGFVVSQESVMAAAGSIDVVTTLRHAPTGCVFTYSCVVPLGKMDPQGGMSAFTYGRRYGLKAAFLLADEDDDAEGAMPVTTTTTKQPATIVTTSKNPFKSNTV